MYQCLVGVDNLFQVDALVGIMGEGRILIKLFIGLNDIIDGGLGLDDCCAENATGKVAALGDEVDVGIEIALHLPQTLANLGDVLVLEGLVDA